MLADGVVEIDDFGRDDLLAGKGKELVGESRRNARRPP